MKRAALPRCIAFVPERSGVGAGLLTHRHVIPAHRCHYQAHAAVHVGVLVCRIHGGMRAKRQRRDHNQVELFTAGTGSTSTTLDVTASA